MDPSRWPTLDPELVGIVKALPSMASALDDVTVSRRQMEDIVPAGPVPHEEDVEFVDVEPAECPPVRVYRPVVGSTSSPGLLYLHGGGFCMGSVALEHGAAVQLAYALRAVVVSVEYRLAPEDPFPAGLEDCYAGLCYLAALDGVDPRRIAVHGQSAGGGLAAAVVLLARDRGGPAIAFQSLGMPALDDRLDTPSMRAFVDTPMWSRRQAEQSWRLYLGDATPNGYAAPARAENLRGLPPAYITTMELDPLRDEGIQYAMRLLEAGVSVELHSYPGTFHGSEVAVTAAVSRRANRELVASLGARLGVKPADF